MRALVLLLACVGCVNPAAVELGEPCSTSADCTDLLVGDSTLQEGECLAVADDPEAGRCFPPIEREPTSCGAALDCIDAAFPLETRCIDGTCACEQQLTCDASSRFVPERCTCKLVINEPCQEDGACVSQVCGVDGECIGVSDDPCDADSDCLSNDCEAVANVCR